MIAGAVVVGGTTAIFSDEEVSAGNTFTAGAIDLTIDNESYYNGVLNKGTTWLEAKDLAGELFFNFSDLKPGDYGEDTISLHVNNNDSYLCADVKITANEDNGSTEPELNDEQPEWTAGRGELADHIYFIWWADDGDNVLETGEQVLSNDPIGNLTIGQTLTVPLADSVHNIWNEGGVGGPLPGDSVRYIGKAWCFGDLTLSPVAQDGDAGTNDPTVDPGFSCNGASENNSTQTDSVIGDVTFRAVQGRHNDGYVCLPETVPTTGAITVDKEIIFTTQGSPVQISDFTLTLTGPSGSQVVTDQVAVYDLVPGAYTVSEVYNGSTSFGFSPTFGLDCSDSNGDHIGELTLSAGQNLTCRITNRETQ
ncbi:CalY family protein [Candidatus Parcubacteria bacterium]|nr:CalY family protein [Candidatus Parcubacteria bacterium]